MSMSVLLVGLVALGCLLLLFKFAGFLLKLALVVGILGLAYYFLWPFFGWPAPPF